MPELPEVEIVRRQLDQWFTGTVVPVEVVDPAVVRHRVSTRPSDADPEGVEALREAMRAPAETPLRHGKRIGWPFGDSAVMVHLGMTGRFTDEPDPPSIRARFGPIAFVDRRRFGCLVVVARDALDGLLREGHGPDALDEAVSGEQLAQIFTGRRAIKVALLDQARLAGLGNIHAAEALWRAGIDPRTPCDRVQRWGPLADGIVAQLTETITAEQDGELVYVTDGGPNPFGVYGREGEPCPRCGHPIAALKQGGRTTYWCPGCQTA